VHTLRNLDSAALHPGYLREREIEKLTTKVPVRQSSKKNIHGEDAKPQNFGFEKSS
jgi:hypothetical protein